MAKFKTICPHCSTGYQLDESMAGKKGRCQKCGATFVIPSQEAEQSAQADPPSPAAPASEAPSIVSPGGDGQYSTLAEALERAPSGAKILVRPGKYSESLVLRKPLEIIGDGPRANIVIEPAGASCLMMLTDRALVRGLTLRGDGGNKCATVNIPQGELVLEDCDITAASSSCVVVHGAAANPVLRRCTIHGSKDSWGVLFSDNARGTLEDCVISGNKEGGVNIGDKADPVLRRCRIRRNGGCAVKIWRQGKGTIEDCRLKNAVSFALVVTGLVLLAGFAVAAWYLSSGGLSAWSLIPGFMALINLAVLLVVIFGGSFPDRNRNTMEMIAELITNAREETLPQMFQGGDTMQLARVIGKNCKDLDEGGVVLLAAQWELLRGTVNRYDQKEIRKEILRKMVDLSYGIAPTEEKPPAPTGAEALGDLFNKMDNQGAQQMAALLNQMGGGKDDKKK
jgi:predicted Zn finger-like uncharacterized protein